MKRETISMALNAIDDSFISESAVYDPGAVQKSPERIIHMKKKRIITFVFLHKKKRATFSSPV